jgi:hypothetical protein
MKQLNSLQATKDRQAEEERKKEAANRDYLASEKAKRAAEIEQEILADLSDESILEIVAAHFAFRNESYRSSAIIDFYSETDRKVPNLGDMHHCAFLFAIDREQYMQSKVHRTAIKKVSGFLYLREPEELHAAIRREAVSKRLNELKEEGIDVKFFHARLQFRYHVEILYPNPEK